MLKATYAAGSVETLSMHHDLWVELARIEMTMEELGHASGDDRVQQQLEARRARLCHAMQRLPE